MRIPFNDLKRQNLALEASIDEALRRVLHSGWYIFGEEVRAFEVEFAQYCGRRHALCVGNGTDALEIALRALGCGPGDEVVTVANAGMYTTAACVQIGAIPVFADIDDSTLQISAGSVARVLGERCKAVVVTHLYGKLADVGAVQDAIGDREIAIVEDCAQAHGAEADGKRAGAFADIAAFSFYPTKNLGALGDGGAVLTERDDLADQVSLLRQYGWTQRFQAQVPYGRNSRMDELQAACLRIKLPHLDRWNSRRREIAAAYREASHGSGLEVVHDPNPDNAAHLCVTRHPDRDAARRVFDEAGISTRIHYPVPDHLQPALQGLTTRQDSDLPITEQVQREILTLPCYPEMTQAEVDHVCGTVGRLADGVT